MTKRLDFDFTFNSWRDAYNLFYKNYPVPPILWYTAFFTLFVHLKRNALFGTFLAHFVNKYFASCAWVTCHVSCVTCYMLHVICHLPPVTNPNSQSHEPFTADCLLAATFGRAEQVINYGRNMSRNGCNFRIDHAILVSF